MTLPPLLIICLLLNSVVDIGDVHPVDEGPTQLHPRVHHQLCAHTVPCHITHLILTFDCMYYTSEDIYLQGLGMEFLTSLHILSSSVVSTTCNKSLGAQKVPKGVHHRKKSRFYGHFPYPP